MIPATIRQALNSKKKVLAYMNFPGTNGSGKGKYRGWVELTAVSHDIHRRGSVGDELKGGYGNELFISKRYDPNAVILIGAHLRGVAVARLDIKMFYSDFTLAITGKNAFVSAHLIKGNAAEFKLGAESWAYVVQHTPSKRPVFR